MPPARDTRSTSVTRTAILLLAGLLACSLTTAALSSSPPAQKGLETPTAAPTSAADLPTEEIAASPTATAAVPSAEAPTALPTSETTATASPEFPPSPTTDITPTASPEAASSPEALAVPRLYGAYEPDEVLVRLRRNADAETIRECLAAAGATVSSEIPDLSVLVLEVGEGDVAYAIAVLSACPKVRSAEPNYMVQAADTIPADASFALQYGLVNIRAPQGWDLQTGSSSVIIGVLDTGVDMGHPDLGAKIVAGHDFVNNDSDASDDNGHGTHVAGIAAAVTNNGTGVAGVSWGARIMPVKVLNAAGNGTFANVAAGLVWAADNGAQIINMSLGGSSDSSVLKSAIDYASAKGVVLVAASGNTGAHTVLFPARYANVIAVGASDASNTRAGSSNYGPELDLMAPGVNIYSTRPGGTYGYLSGTSMAAGYVSGLAAILRGIPGIGSPEVIAWEMENTAMDLGPAGLDDLNGYGLIQMDAAIYLALPKQIEPEPKASPVTGWTGPGQIIASPTPAAPTAILATATVSDTSTPAASTATPATTETAEVWALGAQTPTTQARTLTLPDLGSDWPIGCSGIVLVVGGAILAVVLSRRSSRRRHRQYFRLPHAH